MYCYRHWAKLCRLLCNPFIINRKLPYNCMITSMDSFIINRHTQKQSPHQIKNEYK